MTELESGTETALWWLRGAFAAAMFLAVLSVSDALLALLMYLRVLSGDMQPDLYPEMYQLFEKIATSPLSFLILNLYNMILWSAVFVSSIWLLRFHRRAFRALGYLLQFDMLFTVIHLLYEAWNGKIEMGSREWFLGMNSVQVFAIIVLAHPRIVALVDEFSKKENNPFRDESGNA